MMVLARDLARIAEIQRAMMEMLNQMDGFNELDQVKVIMATNRPDTLDPALLRPGRLDRKVEIPLPNAIARKEILRIHSEKMQKQGEIGTGLDGWMRSRL